MAKMFAIAPMSGGQPDTSPLVAGTDYRGYVFCDQIGNFGAYLFSGTGAQLIALNALPSVIGLVAVTDNGNVRWAELDDLFPNATRTRINTWLTNRGLQTIPAGWTNRRVVREIFERLNDKFSLDSFDVAD